MAVLTATSSQSFSAWDLSKEALPPQGTYVAVCIDCKDEFGIERKKFQSDQMEKVNCASFLFGFRDAQGNPFKHATNRMRISGNEKAALMKFLSAWMGQAPKMGWDYSTKVDQGGMVGRKAIITIAHVAAKSGKQYADMLSIAPCPDALPVGPLGGAPAPAVPTQPAAAAPAVAAPTQPASDPIPF